MPSTKTHTPPDDSLDALALLDADLWILGEAYRMGRAGVSVREERARENLRRELTSLLG